MERFKDRLGVTRYYFRKGKGKRIAIRGLLGSADFLASYQDAAKRYAQAPIPTAGTFNALIKGYLQSQEHLRQKLTSRDTTRRILERFAIEHGNRIASQMRREHVGMILGSMAETPAAANNLLKKVRVLFRWAILNDKLVRDPTLGFKKYKEGEFHTWTEDEIAQFENHWPFGTRERTAFALALYTGQRRADVRKMEWNDIKDGLIAVVQIKTNAKLKIPMHAKLNEALKARPNRGTCIVCKQNGEIYALASFGNFMSEAIGAAGLPDHCVLHGLRKAAARRLAEAGCTVHQIASITGHKTLGEVERYTRAVEQERLARQAMHRFGGSEGN